MVSILICGGFMNVINQFKNDVNNYLKLSASYRKTTGKNGFREIKRLGNTTIQDLYKKLKKENEEIALIKNTLQNISKEYDSLTKNRSIVKNNRIIGFLRKIFSWTKSKVEDEKICLYEAESFNRDLLYKIESKIARINYLTKSKGELKQKIVDAKKKLDEAKKDQTFLNSRVLRHPRLPHLKKDLLSSIKSKEALILKKTSLQNEQEEALAAVGLKEKEKKKLNEEYSKKMQAINAQIKAEEKNEKFLKNEVKNVDKNLSDKILANKNLIEGLEKTLNECNEEYKVVRQQLRELQSLTIKNI